MDTTFWEDIKANDFALPSGHDLTTLTRELFSYLGSPDPNLRGDIAFVILEQWIREQNLYSDAELESMCDELLANLHKGIGESGTDSVFLRTFSIWGLAFIVQRDITNSFMSAERFTQLLEQVSIYAWKEQDVRGWVDGKGWSHATAHIASLLASIALHPLADQATHEQILALIAEHMTRQVEVVYGHGEDDRMAQPVIIILEANLVELSVLEGWLSSDEFSKCWNALRHQNIQRLYEYPQSTPRPLFSNRVMYARKTTDLGRLSPRPAECHQRSRAMLIAKHSSLY